MGRDSESAFPHSAPVAYPPPVRDQGPFGSFTVDVERAGSTARVRAAIELRGQFLPRQAAPALVAFLRRFEAITEKSVQFAPSPASP